MSRNITEKVIFVVTIDTECDHDPAWARSKPLTFHSITRGLPDVLQPAFDAAGAVATYLLTVEVLEDDESVDALRHLHGTYEFGTHLHGAFVEPQKKFVDYAGVDSSDFQCHCPPDIEYRKLENLTMLFERCFGVRPRTFRAGRYGAGPNTIDALDRLGYRVDTSVTPRMYWPHRDGGVDYRSAPEQPYCPAAGSLTVPGPKEPLRVLEVPVTVKPQLLRRPRWLRPWFATAKQMKDVVTYHLKKFEAEPIIVLNMMFHSMEVIPKASPYPQSDAEVRRFVDDMVQVLDWCARLGVEFRRCGDVPDLWLRAHHGVR